MLMFERGALTLLLLACSPMDVIPGGPGHPANPDAPLAGAPPDEADPAVIAAAEKAAIERAMPVFLEHCAGCHTTGGAKASKKKLDHFNMDSYPFGGHHAAEIGPTIRKVLGLAGEAATMPANDPGAVKGEELEVVRAWTEAFDRAHAAGLHEHEGHGGHGHH